MQQTFIHHAAKPQNENWEKLIVRPSPLYDRPDDYRSPFARDYHRILHANAYRRLKHKTQVFFNIDNDHVCTRMEHVAHVESVSATIASALGLNEELTRAIAMGHDLGHAPFGHEGERILKRLSLQYLNRDFWHERNGLRFVDDVELLEDDKRVMHNLNLTYAVRDGIIAHCGEMDEVGLKPRTELFDLQKKFTQVGQYAPCTWEGCVVKLADKIAYVGRDIEDALCLGFITTDDLASVCGAFGRDGALNTTVIIHTLIHDICNHSSPEKGLAFSPAYARALKEVKDFNYTHIYANERLKPFEKYARLVLEELFAFFAVYYDGANTFARLRGAHNQSLAQPFASYLARYCEEEIVPKELLVGEALQNKKIYAKLQSLDIYYLAVIDYISGMTDRYAVKAFQELLNY